MRLDIYDVIESVRFIYRVRNLALQKRYDQNSGLLLRIAELVKNKKWNSAWLILVEDGGKSWYNTEKIYWKGSITTRNAK